MTLNIKILLHGPWSWSTKFKTSKVYVPRKFSYSTLCLLFGDQVNKLKNDKMRCLYIFEIPHCLLFCNKRYGYMFKSLIQSNHCNGKYKNGF